MVEIPIRSPAVWFEHLPSGTFEELAKMGPHSFKSFHVFSTQDRFGYKFKPSHALNLYIEEHLRIVSRA
jgi:hypothetical protein